MTARQYLKEIGQLKREKARLEEQLQHCHLEVPGIGAIEYDKDRVQTSPKNQIEEAAWKMMEYRPKYTNRLAEVAKQIELHRAVIEKVSDKHREAVMMRYYDGQEYATIAETLHISRYTAYNYVCAGLHEIDEKGFINEK